MAITYHAGRRLQATSTDFAGIPAVAGGWKEIGRTTLSGSATSIDVSSLADKRYLMVLYNMIDDGSNSQFITNQFGNGSFDTGSNYAERGSSNGATDFAYTGNSYWNTSGGDQVCPEFTVQYLANKSDKEKLGISHSCGAQADGAGTAPNRREHTGKWANTSNVIDRIRATTAYGSRTYGTDSEVVVLGWDPADTHTTNFWEEIGTASGTGLADITLDSSKKYNWIQAFFTTTSSSGIKLRLGNGSLDAGSNYTRRQSTNGASDTTAINEDGISFASGWTSSYRIFLNAFIINNSANEKLIIANLTYTQAGSNQVPARYEIVGKWTNTSALFNHIGIVNDASSLIASSEAKVWGSD